MTGHSSGVPLLGFAHAAGPPAIAVRRWTGSPADDHPPRGVHAHDFLVLLYVASRTVNLPFGGVHTVHNDRPQDPDILGTVVVAAELLTLATGPALLSATARRWATNALLLAGLGLWAAWGTGLL